MFKKLDVKKIRVGEDPPANPANSANQADAKQPMDSEISEISNISSPPFSDSHFYDVGSDSAMKTVPGYSPGHICAGCVNYCPEQLNPKNAPGGVCYFDRKNHHPHDGNKCERFERITY